MAINNISNTSNQIFNLSTDIQSRNTNKLSTGFKINRNSDAASLSIKTKNSEVVSENAQASMSSIDNIDKADAMVEEVKNRILSNPNQAVLAQANQTNAGVASLI